MKKLLLALVACSAFTIAVAKTNTTIDAVDTAPTFELKKAGPVQFKGLTPYQICIMDCLNTYSPWQERALERCLSNCGV